MDQPDNCVVMAFSDGTEAGFWLGAKRSTKGSSHGTVYEVEWYAEVDGAFELEGVELDLMKTSRLLVEDVDLVFEEGSDSRFFLTSASKALIVAATTERLAQIKSGEFVVSDAEDNLPCEICNEEDADMDDDGIICDGCDQCFHRE